MVSPSPLLPLAADAPPPEVVVTVEDTDLTEVWDQVDRLRAAGRQVALAVSVVGAERAASAATPASAEGAEAGDPVRAGWEIGLLHGARRRGVCAVGGIDPQRVARVLAVGDALELAAAEASA